MTDPTRPSWPRSSTGFEDLATALESQLTRDEQTGLFTRGAFVELLDAFAARASQRRIPLSMAVLEMAPRVPLAEPLDDAEEDPLAILAEQVADVLRKSDPIGRLGGDRIAVLLPGCRGDDMRSVGVRLQRALETGVIVCIGLAENAQRTRGQVGQELYDRAGRALSDARDSVDKLHTALAA